MRFYYTYKEKEPLPEEFIPYAADLQYMYYQALNFAYFDYYFYKISEPLKLKILPYILYLSAWIYTLYKILI